MAWLRRENSSLNTQPPFLTIDVNASLHCFKLKKCKRHYDFTNLTNYVLVSEANNKAVLRRVVLVFILGHQTFAGIIISFTLCNENVQATM